MINQKAETAQYVASWIAHRARIANAKSLVVGISGGVDSAVVAGLAVKTGLPVHGVIMPCHSSPDSKARAEEVIAKFGLIRHEVNLEAAFASISSQLQHPEVYDKAGASGALRSCLRAPTLDYVGKLFNGLIVGTGNRDEDEVTRYYQKRGDGAVDISPISVFHKSEVYELAVELGVPQSVINATPSADLQGPNSGQTDEGQLGMSYAEIERATRAVQRLFGSTQGNNFTELAEYLQANDLGDERFRTVLRNLGQMEIASRHKVNPNLPQMNLQELQSMGYVQK